MDTLSYLLQGAVIQKSPVERSINTVRNLDHQSKHIDDLILWLDCDREGEAIAFDVMEMCRAHEVRTKRAHFSALTMADVKNAMVNL